MSVHIFTCSHKYIACHMKRTEREYFAISLEMFILWSHKTLKQTDSVLLKFINVKAEDWRAETLKVERCRTLDYQNCAIPLPWHRKTSSKSEWALQPFFDLLTHKTANEIIWSRIVAAICLSNWEDTSTLKGFFRKWKGKLVHSTLSWDNIFFFKMKAKH